MNLPGKTGEKGKARRGWWPEKATIPPECRKTAQYITSYNI